MNIHILVLVIAIILFGLLAFKQMSALILAPLVTSFVIICSGMPILDSLKNLFMPAAAEYVTSYFFGILCRSFCSELFTSILVQQNRSHVRSPVYVTENL